MIANVTLIFILIIALIIFVAGFTMGRVHQEKLTAKQWQENYDSLNQLRKEYISAKETMEKVRNTYLTWMKDQ